MMLARCRRAGRRGAMLLETGMAALILVVAMAMVTKALAAVAYERRAYDRRQAAASEAAWAMEQLAARPYDALAPGRVGDLALSAGGARSLPEGELAAEVVEADPAGGPDSKRIDVRVRWKNRAGDWDAPVRLTTWVHRREEAR